MCLPSPDGLGFSLLPVALVGVQARGFFSCNGESATGDLFDVGLVDFGHDLFECCCIKALGENGSPADDIRPGLQFLRVALEHFGLDFVADSFGFCLRFIDDRLPFLESFDLAAEFYCRHVVFSFVLYFGLAPWLYVSSEVPNLSIFMYFYALIKGDTKLGVQKTIYQWVRGF